MKPVGPKIKEIRLAKGLKQQEVATKAQISKGYLSDIENNKRTPTIPIIDRICFALGVDTAKVIYQTQHQEELTQEREKLLEQLKPLFDKITQLLNQ